MNEKKTYIIILLVLLPLSLSVVSFAYTWPGLSWISNGSSITANNMDSAFNYLNDEINNLVATPRGAMVKMQPQIPVVLRSGETHVFHNVDIVYKNNNLIFGYDNAALIYKKPNGMYHVIGMTFEADINSSYACFRDNTSFPTYVSMCFKSVGSDLYVKYQDLNGTWQNSAHLLAFKLIKAN